MLTSIVYNSFFQLYKDILLNTNIVILLATLIAGLFGFMIAALLFAIQFFSQDFEKQKNDFLEQLIKEEFKDLVEPMLARFIKILYLALSVFVCVFFLSILQAVNIKDMTFLYIEIMNISLYKYGVILLFYGYIATLSNFFFTLTSMVRDLQTLVFIFIKSKKNLSHNTHFLKEKYKGDNQT